MPVCKVVYGAANKLATLLNVPSRLVPTLTAVMITTEIPPAIRAYSIAVAPDSSFTKRETIFVIGNFRVYTWLVKLTFSLAGVSQHRDHASP